MKKRLILKTLVGFAVSAVSVQFANAQTPIVDNTGDLTLGFYASSGTGASEDVMVDLGPLTKFTSATGTIDLTGTNGLSFADLTSTYGSATDPNLFFGFIAGNGTTQIPGTTHGNNNLWFSQPEIPAGTVPGNLPGQSRTVLQQASNSGVSFNLALNTLTSTANSTVTGIVPTSQSNSYFALDTTNGTTPVNFNGVIDDVDNNIANANANGDIFSTLQYIIAPTTITGLGNPAITLGTFDFNPSKGTLTFTPVPEPSSLGLTGVGFLSLIGFVALRRRRSALA